jgi:hypothetical protein
MHHLLKGGRKRKREEMEEAKEQLNSMEIDNERALLNKAIEDLQDQVTEMDNLKMENLDYKEKLSNLYKTGVIDKEGILKE